MIIGIVMIIILISSLIFCLVRTKRKIRPQVIIPETQNQDTVNATNDENNIYRQSEEVKIDSEFEISHDVDKLT